MREPWRQINVTIAPGAADAVITGHLAPTMTQLRDRNSISGWWFIRKTPTLRVRYQLTPDITRPAARSLNDAMAQWTNHDQVTAVIPGVIYEPETHTLGGTKAITIAHELWSRDTDAVVGYLTSPHVHARKELGVLLIQALLRGAGLDWLENGEVWARVAQYRDTHQIDQEQTSRLAPVVRRFLTLDTTPPTPLPEPLSFASQWFSAYQHAGQALRRLADSGQLTRGLRAVLAHHIIHAWNRLGLPSSAQARLAVASRQAILGAFPTTTPIGRNA